MYPRIYKPLKNASFFLFGARGTGKTTWLKSHYADAKFVNLLDSTTYLELKANPSRIRRYLGPSPEVIVVDEIQRIPEMLNDIHSLIEEDKHRTLILTGSSARKLKREGANLLAGRALQRSFYPLTIWEMAKDFNIEKALKFGLLPAAQLSDDPKDFLKSYVHTYLKEEVTAEGLLQSLDPFVRFLESISFSQGQTLSYSSIGREVGVDPKTIKNYVLLLEDLLLAETLTVFTKKAKRKLIQQSKFYFIDSGIFRSLRPRGPLDSEAELNGPALETLFFHHHRVLNEVHQMDQKLHFWRTQQKQEVDFVSYGPQGLFAFEIKHSARIREEDLVGISLFKKDYPMARCFCFYGGETKKMINNVELLPFQEGLESLPKIFNVLNVLDDE